MKSTIFNTNLTELIEYISRDGSDESEASVSLNPSFSWAKFILTDDMANENKQRIPKNEFANLVRTGVHAPMKMELGDPLGDHPSSTPLGVITHLKEVDNKIEGIAALWTREREEDVTSLKQMFSEGKLPQLSWEVMFEESKVDENGVEDLLGTALRAVTIVGMPAYAGRTPIIALASKQGDETNLNTEESTVEELEILKAKVAELETSLSTKDGEIASLNTELTELRQYKEVIETERAQASRLVSIKEKFTSSNIEKGDQYFVDNKDMLLGMSESALEFMIQELIAFKQSTSTSSRNEVPGLTAEPSVDEEDVKRLAEMLRNRKK